MAETEPARADIRYYTMPLDRRRVAAAGALGTAVALAVLGWQLASVSSGGTRAAAARPRHAVAKRRKRVAAPTRIVGAINPDVPGITTFRGNLTRSYYGEGPVPRHPRILWRYPDRGGMCARSADENGTRTWCGVGWTGQPNVVPLAKRTEIRFGAYDDRYHFLDGKTGRPVRPDLQTGDLAKGSATSDPDGYPLYYAGSRDNRLRIVALDRREPAVLWSVDAASSVPEVVWNNDWDGAPLVVGDYLLEGGENSWFYVIRLNRGYGRDGLVRVRPRIVLTVPSWDAELVRDAPAKAFSIENSVAFRDGVVYFANSAGLVQGWDISHILRGKKGAKRVFRFWTGDDTDASIVVDDYGYLYVASELERFDGRSSRVGQLMKLDPRRPRRPLVWSVAVPDRGWGGKGGIWSTPAIDRGMLYVATNAGGLLGVNRESGRVLWRLPLPGPTWSSPVVVDGVLLQGDCSGVFHAYDVRRQRRAPRELWRISLGGCIEATPAVWRGGIYIGTRGGAMYAIGDARKRR